MKIEKWKGYIPWIIREIDERLLITLMLVKCGVGEGEVGENTLPSTKINTASRWLFSVMGS